jgi:hypothetical protein
MFFLFWVWSACVEHALTGMGSFCMQEGRLCLMNLRWWKAWSLTEVTYPHTLSPMPRHKKWWVQMSTSHFQALKLYLSSVILVANHAWFTRFLSTYDSGTWESSDSWNPKLCTDPVLFCVVNCAWFTLFLSTHDSGTWESSSSWNPKFFTNPVFFGCQLCVIHSFSVNIWFRN